MGYQRMTSGGSVSPTLQSKTASPSTSQQIIIPDSGYDGLSDVTIDAMHLQNKTVTPTSSQQIITADSGYDGLDEVTVEAGGTVHTDTYTPAVNTSANDMGASHKYRYVNTSGMIKPSGTTSASYTTNGTSTVNVKNYENINITRNISASLSRTTLWTNSSPSSSVGDSTVTLSSMAPYTYLEFYYAQRTSSSKYNCSIIVKVSDMRNTSSGDNHPVITLSGRVGALNYARRMFYVSDTSIRFLPPATIGNTSTNNTYMIPLYIYGLK